MARLLPTSPLRLFRGQRHLRRHFDAHTLVVVEHLLGDDATGFLADAHHFRHVTRRSFLESVGGKHGLELIESVGAAVGESRGQRMPRFLRCSMPNMSTAQAGGLLHDPAGMSFRLSRPCFRASQRATFFP